MGISVRYTVTCDSDIGRSRKMNQDAVTIKHISTANEEVVLAVICDGMGGLKDGEIASTSVVKAFLKWFDNAFVKDISHYKEERIFSEWTSLINEINSRIYLYGKKQKISLGTTLTAMLIINEDYYIANIGDCRAYELTDTIRQVTDDHSVVSKEVREGKITEEQARFDSRRNRLLRSIGVMSKTRADYYTGKVAKRGVYMLCCDGVRNKVYDDEFLYFFHPSVMTNKSNMDNNINYIFYLNKLREENDNMSVVLIKDNETTIVLQNDDNQIVIENEKIIINSDMYIDINGWEA